MDELRVAVYASRADLGAAAAAVVTDALQRAIAVQGSARVILASAASQRELVAELARAEVEWSRVTVFHMDEYTGVRANDPRSFRRWLQVHLLDRVRVAAFHGLRGEAHDLTAECARYAGLLAAAPVDVACLGIGENGHLAFNDPHVADFTDGALVKVVEIDDRSCAQQVSDGAFATVAEVPRRALTLTIPALVGARETVCVVPGPRKAEAVRAALQGPVETRCPASILRRVAGARLYLDREAAALLTSRMG